MDIIIKPVLTEKMTIQGEKLNRYGFIETRSIFTVISNEDGSKKI